MPDRFPESHVLLEAARRSFPEFYRLGDPVELDALDALVLAYAALALGMHTRRPRGDQELARKLDRATDISETLFMQLKEAVQACPVLGRIPTEERRRIAETVFQMQVPPEAALGG